MEVYGIIYLLIDATNDKEYVGQTTRTVEERFKEHAGNKKSFISRTCKPIGNIYFLSFYEAKRTKKIHSERYCQARQNFWTARRVFASARRRSGNKNV